jgi:NAD(P)H-dependent FMN reductase
MPGISTPQILLISGSLRRQSTNTALLRTAQAVARARVVTVLYDELGDLPHFNPDDDVVPVDPVVARLRAAIHTADAVLFSTPEYAGALPGSFKNLLDWTIGDDHVRSMYQKPVAWIVASLRGADNAYDSLRTVLGFAHAVIVEAACSHIPVTTAMIDDDDLIGDLAVRGKLTDTLNALAASIGTI